MHTKRRTFSKKRRTELARTSAFCKMQLGSGSSGSYLAGCLLCPVYREAWTANPYLPMGCANSGCCEKSQLQNDVIRKLAAPDQEAATCQNALEQEMTLLVGVMMQMMTTTIMMTSATILMMIDCKLESGSSLGALKPTQGSVEAHWA